jgi:ABC-type Fe3+/spermidine/putrescine transport system ATPase subunit
MKKIITVTIISLLMFFGCTKKEEIKPSPDSLLTAEAINAMNAIKTAYESKNEDDLQKHLGEVLLDNILNNPSVDEVKLDLTPRMVRLTDEAVRVHLNWKAQWRIGKEQTIKDRGVAYFVFHKETMKLTYIEGDNPFLIPSLRE